MAASSTDDIPTQLAALLGRGADIVTIRKANEDPPAVSVIDVIQFITRMAKKNAGNYYERARTTHPEASTNCRN